MENNSREFLYIGVDVHKDQHAAVMTDCFGQPLGQMDVKDTKEDFNRLIQQVRVLAGRELKPVFGLEDTTNYGLRLASHLYQQGLTVKTVSPVLVSRGRKYKTHPEKSDFLDAQGVAKALIFEIGKLPSFNLTETERTASEIKELVIDREFLVKEQTRIKNQLHRLLHRAFGSGYRAEFKNVFAKKALKHWLKSVKAVDSPLLKNQIKRKVKRIVDIKEEISEIENELRILVDRTDQKLETLNGCGLVLAAAVLAEVKNIKRFESADSLAKYGGFCPREKSSGRTLKRVKTRAGNRKLNKAIHRIALAQIGRNGNQYGKEYFKKKVSEGKSKAQALCCLKRKLVNIIFAMLRRKEEYKYQKNLT